MPAAIVVPLMAGGLGMFLPAVARPARMQRVIAASVAGSVLEWYDFFLYATASTLVFGQLFFPIVDNPLLGTLAAMGALAVGFVARPLGGILFGHCGDRYGSRIALLMALALMGAATFLMGLLPTYQSIGVLAPAALVLLRLVQGVALGGQWTGGVLVVAEAADPRRRGMLSAWSGTGMGGGFLLATLAFYLVQQLPATDVLRWGWRLPFLASALIVPLGMWIRHQLPPDPPSGPIATQITDGSLPIVQLLRTQRRELLIAIGLRSAESTGFYLFAVFSLIYADFADIPQRTVLLAGMAATVAEMFAIVGFGALSDRIGRRPVYFLGAAGMFVFSAPFFSMIDTGDPGLILIALLLGTMLCHGAMAGTQPAFFTELFRADLRYSGLGVGHECANIFAGGLAPVIATTLLVAFQSSWPVALYMMGMAAITIVALIFAREPLASIP